MVFRQIENDGYAIREDVLSEQEIDELIDALERRKDGNGLRRGGKVFAVPNLLDIAEIRKVADSEPVRDLARAVLGGSAFPVRGILFDKIPEANWRVPWHQDVTIAVQGKAEVKGFGPWTT